MLCLIKQTLHLADCSIIELQIETVIRLPSFDTLHIPSFLTQINRFQRTHNHPLISILQLLQPNLTNPYQLLPTPQLQYNFILSSALRRSIMWKDVDMLAMLELTCSEFYGLLGHWDFVATCSYGFAEI